ncbi:hypothetical protein RYA05_00215 [Pseudomonas syringae pv. actinidiae]|nr:hypothetical protein [Pseudomonas syringae pv. actinidiae]
MSPFIESEYENWKAARVNATSAVLEIYQATLALAEESNHTLHWMGCNKSGMTHFSDRYGHHELYDYIACTDPDGTPAKIFNFHGYIGDKKKDVAKYLLGAQPATLGSLLGRFNPSVYPEWKPMSDNKLDEILTLAHQLPCLDWMEGDIHNRKIQGDQIRYNCRHDATDAGRKTKEDYWVSLGDLCDDHDQFRRSLFSRIIMAISPRNVISIIEQIKEQKIEASHLKGASPTDR